MLQADMEKKIKGRQARAGKTRTAILDATTALLGSKNFDEIKLTDIATEAGIAKGSVLAHFTDKAAILATFLAHRVDETTSKIESDIDSAKNATHLTEALVSLSVYLTTDTALIRLIAGSYVGTACEELLIPASQRLQSALAQAFAYEGKVDAELCAEVVIALLVHDAVTGGCMSDELEKKNRLERLFSIIYA